MAWTRRKFVKSGFWAAVALGLIDSFWIEKFFIETNEFFLGSANKTGPEFKIIQISDLHIQSVTYQLKQLAKKLNDLNPTLILVTGDAVDTSKNIPVLNEFLGLINSSIKKVAILGNWEYWGYINLNELRKLYADKNCDLLINETRQYHFDGKIISITGVDNYVGGHADIDKALQLYRKSDYHIVLNHCPEYSDIIYSVNKGEVPIDLILAGHTHGGQINLFGFVPFKPQGSGNYLKGWYTGENKNMYVSKGIGTSIFPLRFMARAEIAIFTIMT